MLRRGRIFIPQAMSPELRWRSAVHESAHAIVGTYVFGDRSQLVSILLREQEYCGRTQRRHQTEADSAHSSRHPLNQAITALAGITAEGELLGNESMGAGHDVDAATAAIMML